MYEQMRSVMEEVDDGAKFNPPNKGTVNAARDDVARTNSAIDMVHVYPIALASCGIG